MKTLIALLLISGVAHADREFAEVVQSSRVCRMSELLGVMMQNKDESLAILAGVAAANLGKLIKSDLAEMKQLGLKKIPCSDSRVIGVLHCADNEKECRAGLDKDGQKYVDIIVRDVRLSASRVVGLIP